MQLEVLVQEIEKHNRCYWEEYSPEITDSHYDQLIEQLRGMAPSHPLLTSLPGSSGGCKHARPMLSLQKCYTEDALLKWAKDLARSPDEIFVVTGKWDGCSIEVLPNRRCLTRGDGLHGEPVDHVSGVCPPGLCYGELVVLKSTFVDKRPRSKSGNLYRNPRAAAAGLIADRSSDVSLLRFVPFDYEQEEVAFCELHEVDWEAVMSSKQQGDIPTDGLVITLKDLAYKESLGNTEHHPRHSIALKYKNPAGITELLDVQFQCGKFRISPVGIVAPVEISGTTTTKVTLHNQNFIEKHDVRVGDTVKLAKMGDVIPGLEAVVVHRGGSRIICEHCPVCGVPPTLEGGDYVCQNPKCAGGPTQSLIDALTRIEIENIGPGVASELVRAGYCTLPQLFEMATVHWMQIPGFAPKSAEAMQRQFASRKRAPIEDYRILAAMNIEGVGLTLAKKLCNAVHISEIPHTDLTLLEGIGAVRATQIRSGFDSSLWSWFLVNTQVVFTKGLADRPTICFTGAATDGRTRDEWIKQAEAKGFAYQKAVTKTLGVLVASRTDSTKAKKASAYGTRVVTYEQFAEELKDVQV